jgi:hypothetical protein
VFLPAENTRLLKSNAAKLPHEELIERGYNVVPVDAQEAPPGAAVQRVLRQAVPGAGSAV